MLRIERDAGVYPKDTICEVHRQMFDVMVLELKDKDPATYGRLLPLLDKAFIMAKKMGHRLMEYKDMGEDLWLPHGDQEAVVELRKKRIEALKRAQARGDE